MTRKQLQRQRIACFIAGALFVIIIQLLSNCVRRCVAKSDDDTSESSVEAVAAQPIAEEQAQTPRSVPSDASEIIAQILGERQTNRYDITNEMPDTANHKLRINYLGGTLGRVFNDSNHVHLDAVERVGIKPVTSAADAWSIDRPIVHVASNENYFIENLSQSHPYLIPSAEALLSDIGRAFSDSLHARGGGDYRIRVTSLLRTTSSVDRLRRRNRNAVEHSAHLHGTTFDISYVKFVYDTPGTPTCTQEDLKNLLGEILYDMREQGRCYVKYERKQGCFHISTRI